MIIIGTKRCHYCGIRVQRYKSKKNSVRPLDARTKDHLIPLCRGGSSLSHNVVISCSRCNEEKGQLTADEYRAVLRHRKLCAVVNGTWRALWKLLKIKLDMFPFI